MAGHEWPTTSISTALPRRGRLSHTARAKADFIPIEVVDRERRLACPAYCLQHGRVGLVSAKQWLNTIARQLPPVHHIFVRRPVGGANSAKRKVLGNPHVQIA